MMQIEFYADIFKQKEYVRHYGNTMTVEYLFFVQCILIVLNIYMLPKIKLWMFIDICFVMPSNYYWYCVMLFWCGQF